MQIKDRIKAAGLTGAEIADRLGVDESTVSLKLNGKRQWKPDELIAVRNALGEAGSPVTLDQLFDEAAA